jgi:ribosomal protein S18 acetylase RimI-like enzyme
MQKLHLGSQLVIHVVDKMKENGCEEVVLETELSNSGAQRLYKRLGFIKDKRLARCAVREIILSLVGLESLTFTVS